ncbi:hypothetical protein DFS33DRAFT_1336239 [Desarmillaria ectypa]|nr:hypothetical protein DFS33DRAFT_1336239 [Desarmillaria ectypa]
MTNKIWFEWSRLVEPNVCNSIALTPALAFCSSDDKENSACSAAKFFLKFERCIRNVILNGFCVLILYLVLLPSERALLLSSTLVFLLFFTPGPYSVGSYRDILLSAPPKHSPNLLLFSIEQTTDRLVW